MLTLCLEVRGDHRQEGRSDPALTATRTGHGDHLATWERASDAYQRLVAGVDLGGADNGGGRALPRPAGPVHTVDHECRWCAVAGGPGHPWWLRGAVDRPLDPPAFVSVRGDE